MPMPISPHRWRSIIRNPHLAHWNRHHPDPTRPRLPHLLAIPLSPPIPPVPIPSLLILGHRHRGLRGMGGLTIDGRECIIAVGAGIVIESSGSHVYR